MNSRLARPICCLAAILVLGVVLRFDHLVDRPIWFDEAFSYRLAQEFSWTEMVERTARDVHPPLYYAVLRCWVAGFGTSPFAMRSLSIAFAGLTIVAFYLFCRDVFSSESDDPNGIQRRLTMKAALTAALLIALSPVHIHWSYETRMYTLATALLGLSTWMMLRALRSPRHGPVWWTGYTIAAAALLYTHNYALFSVAAQWLFLAVFFAYQPCGWIDTLRDPRMRQALVAVTGAAILYAPWVPVLLAQKSRVQADYWIPAITRWSVPEAWLALIFPTNTMRPGSHAEALTLVALLIAAMVAFLYVCRQGRPLVMCMIVCPVALAALISIASVSIIVDRHFLFAYMFGVCALARLVAGLPRVEGSVVLCLLVANSAAAVWNYHDSLQIGSSPGIRGAMEYVLARRHPREPIVILHPCIYFSAKYYARDGASVHLYLRKREPTHYTGGPILRAEDCWRESDLAKSSASRVWVLHTSGFTAGFSGRTSMPEGWNPVGRGEKFHSVYFFEGDVSIQCYERTVTAAPAKIKGEARHASTRPGHERTAARDAQRIDALRRNVEKP